MFNLALHTDVSYLDSYSPTVIGVGPGKTGTVELEAQAETAGSGSETAEPEVCRFLFVSLHMDTILGEVTIRRRKKLKEMTQGRAERDQHGNSITT